MYRASDSRMSLADGRSPPSTRSSRLQGARCRVDTRRGIACAMPAAARRLAGGDRSNVGLFTGFVVSDVAAGATARGMQSRSDVALADEAKRAMSSCGTAARTFIRRTRSDIIAEWKQLVRDLPPASPLTSVALLDHIPELLDDIVDAVASGPALAEVGVARRHADARLEMGFDIGTLVQELSMLRRCIWRVGARAGVQSEVLQALDVAADAAIATSVARFAEARERTLVAIDRISTASLESQDLRELLDRLLRVFMETTAAVDTAAILLVEGDRLHLRATVGLEEELARGFSLRLDEGFAGEVARERKPRELRSAYLDESIKSEVLRDKQVQALYGLPLVHGDQLIGVAYMGSLVAHEFAQEDRQLFGSMAARATVGIVHHMLREQVNVSEAQLKTIVHERERALAKLEALLAACPIGIAFFDRDLRYIRINQALAAINARSVDEHIGRSISEIVPDLAHALEPIMQRVLASGEPVLNVELSGNPPSTPEETRAFLGTFFPVRVGQDVTGIGVVLVEVTDLKRAQQALQVSEARFQSIIEHAPAAIFVIDREGRLLLANQHAAAALGRPGESVLGARSAELLPSELDLIHTKTDHEVLTQHRAITTEEVVPSPQGPRTFLSIKFPIPGANGDPVVCGIATEITDRKRVEQELRAAVLAREDVLAIVSHDLRNPLGTIQLSASMMMAQPGVDPRARRHLEVIQRSSVRMDHLIDDLLAFATIQAGKLMLARAIEDVESLVAEAVELHEPLAQEKGVQLVVGELAHAQLDCDRNRLLQVFANLIGNAIKFCRTGDIVTVGAVAGADLIELYVADTGPGIDASVAPRLFDAYSSSAKDAKRGTGLGLYITKGIVEAHGGRVCVQSDARGTRFSCFLPTPLRSPVP